MTSHGYGGTDRVEGKGTRVLCLCGWKSRWETRIQGLSSLQQHIANSEAKRNRTKAVNP